MLITLRFIVYQDQILIIWFHLSISNSVVLISDYLQIYYLWLFPNQGYADPPPLRSGHFDIKDAQWAETKYMLNISYHIISRFRFMGVQMGRYGRPKIQFSSKVAKFAEKIGIDLTLIFCIYDFFCAILSF